MKIKVGALYHMRADLEIGLLESLIRITLYPDDRATHHKVVFQILASSIFSTLSNHCCMTEKSFQETVVREISLKELPLFVGWYCGEEYQVLLQLEGRS